MASDSGMSNLDQSFGDLYNDVYYDTNETNYNETIVRDYGTVTTFFRGSLVLLLRAGFVLIQIGCIPITDVHIILLQNIIDIACATIAYGVLGYIFSFGYDTGGIIGTGSWIVADDADIDNAILGWSAVITAMAIFTTVVAGRMHCIGYIIVAVLSGGILQAIVIHWVWASTGWMHRTTFVGHNVSYKDQGGGMIIHVFGGILALFGALFLGRRILRLRDLDESSLPPEAPGSVVAGYFLLMIGFMGVCLPSPTYEMTHMPGNYIGNTLISNIMAAAGGIMTVVLLQFIVARDMLDHWIILRCMQGAIAGIVTIAPGVDVYKPLVAFGISIPGAIIFYFLAHHLYVTAMEDYANIIPIHLVCGLFGTFLPPLCGSSEGLGATHKAVIHLGWQVICDLIILATIIVPALILFLLLSCLGFLRNRTEEQNHRRALTVVSRGPPRSFFQRLFSIGDDPQFLQPGYRTKNEANLTSPEITSRNRNLMGYNQNPSIKAPSIQASKQESAVHDKMVETTGPKELEAVTDVYYSSPSYSRDSPIGVSKNNDDSENNIGEDEIQSLYVRKMKRQIYTLSTDMINLSNTEAGTNVEGEVENMEETEPYYDSDSTDEEVYSYTTRAQIHAEESCTENNTKTSFTNLPRGPTPYINLSLNGIGKQNSKKYTKGSTRVSFIDELPRAATPFRPINKLQATSCKLPITTYKSVHSLPTLLAKKTPRLFRQNNTCKQYSGMKLNPIKFNSCNKSVPSSKLNQRKSHPGRPKHTDSKTHSDPYKNCSTKQATSKGMSHSQPHLSDSIKLNKDHQNRLEASNDVILSPTEYFRDFRYHFDYADPMFDSK